jgi:hypothetical protein
MSRWVVMGHQLLFERNIYVVVKVPNLKLFFVFWVAFSDLYFLHCIGQDVACLWARIGSYNKGSWIQWCGIDGSRGGDGEIA